MAWTYSGNPGTSAKDEVRFLIGDTDPNSPQLTDEEIEYLLSTNSSPTQAAIEACKTLVAKYARMVDYTIGPESVKAGQRAENYKKLADDLSSKLIQKYAGPLWEVGAGGKPIFDIGMHDNGSGGGPEKDG